MQRTCAQDLPEEIIVKIARNLSALDVRNLGLSCRSFKRVCSSQRVWLDVLSRDVHSRSVPTPHYSQPLSSLSGSECEALALHTVRLQDQLCSPKDNAVKFTTLHGKRPVTWVRLVQGKWLLVASSERTASVITLWDVASLLAPSSSSSSSPPVPTSEAFLEAPVYSGLVDIQDGVVTIALELVAEWSFTVTVLTLVSTGGRPAFSRLATHDGVSRLRTLHGPWIGFAVHNELSVPTLLNWRSGRTVHLASMPNTKGGTIAMDIRDDLVVAVSPDKVDIFAIVGGVAAEEATVRHFRKIELKVSVGFADIKILEPPPGAPTSERELRLAIAGEDGMFLYSVALGPARADTALIGDELAQVWHQPVVETGFAEVDASYPFKPLIDPSGTFSWLEAILPEKWTLPPRQFSFHTLSRRPNIPPPDGEDTPPHVFVLDHPELPALYAMGVYDYDASLGLAIFGNYYGETALFDLSGSYTGTGALQRCFQPLTIPTQPTDCILPEIPVAVSSGLPFPYSDTHAKFADDARDRMFAYWQAFPTFPREPPPPWEIDAIDTEEDGEWAYMPYVQRLPRCGVDQAWALEHVCHFYGTPVPLLRHFAENLIIFQAGGLLFFMSNITLEECSVVQQEMSLDALARDLDLCRLPPHEELRMDRATRRYMCHVMFMRRAELNAGRDRWAETKERGGDVNLDAWSRYML